MKQLSLLVLACSSILFSCKNNEEGINLPKIAGQWEIVNAYRNGAPTQSVHEGYFTFTNNKVFETNIPGLPNGQSFEIKKGVLMIANDTCHYRFSNVTDSIATINVMIREMAFQFELKKKKDM